MLKKNLDLLERTCELALAWVYLWRTAKPERRGPLPR